MQHANPHAFDVESVSEADGLGNRARTVLCGRGYRPWLAPVVNRKTAGNSPKICRAGSNNPEYACGNVAASTITKAIAPVLRDRRKVNRRPINRVAKFHTGVGALPRDCMITDISDNGARLYCEAEMPEQFTLFLIGDGPDVRQECRVVWRLGGELGVEFTRRVPR
jgi:hypothetical protein